MDRGELDSYQATKIAEVTTPLSDEVCGKIDTALVDRLAGKDAAQIRRVARDLVHRFDGAGANERAERRREDRKLELCHEEDAMATIAAYIPAETASAIYTRVDSIARTLRPGETRTLEQLRADVFTDLLLGTSTGHKASVWHRVHRLRLRHHPRHRPNPPQATGRPRRVDPSTRPRMPHARLPPPRPPQRPRPRTTLAHRRKNAANLHSLCRAHNLLKEQPGWHFQHNPGTSELAVTTPAGRTHVEKPTGYFRQ